MRNIIGFLIFSASILMAISQNNSFNNTGKNDAEASVREFFDGSNDNCPDIDYVFMYNMSNKEIKDTIPKINSLYNVFLPISESYPDTVSAPHLLKDLIKIRKVVPYHVNSDLLIMQLKLKKGHEILNCNSLLLNKGELAVKELAVKECIIEGLSNDEDLIERLRLKTQSLISIVIKNGTPYFKINEDVEKTNIDDLLYVLDYFEITISTKKYFKCPKEINVKFHNFLPNVGKEGVRLHDDDSNQAKRCQKFKNKFRGLKGEIKKLNDKNATILKWMDEFAKNPVAFTEISNFNKKLKKINKSKVSGINTLLANLRDIGIIVNRIDKEYNEATGIKEFISTYIFQNWKYVLQLSDIAEKLSKLDDINKGLTLVSYISSGYAFDTKNKISLIDLLDELIIIQTALNKKSTSNDFEVLNGKIKTLRNKSANIQSGALVFETVLESLPVLGPIFTAGFTGNQTDKVAANETKIDKVKKQISQFFNNFYFYQKNKKIITYLHDSFTNNFCNIIKCNTVKELKCGDIAQTYKVYNQKFSAFVDKKDEFLKNIEEKIEYNEISSDQLTALKNHLSSFEKEGLEPGTAGLIADTVIGIADYLNIPVFDMVTEFIAQPIYYGLKSGINKNLHISVSKFYDGASDHYDMFSQKVKNSTSELNNRTDAINILYESYKKYNNKYKELGKFKVSANYPSSWGDNLLEADKEGVDPLSEMDTDNPTKNPALRDANGNPMIYGKVYKLYGTFRMASIQVKWTKETIHEQYVDDDLSFYGDADFVRLIMYPTAKVKTGEVPTGRPGSRNTYGHYRYHDDSDFYFKINRIENSVPNTSNVVRKNDRVWIEAFGKNVMRQNSQYKRNILNLRQSWNNEEKVVLNWGDEERDKDYKVFNFLQDEGSNEVYIGMAKNLKKNGKHELADYIKMNIKYGESVSNKSEATKFKFIPSSYYYNDNLRDGKKIYKDKLSAEELNNDKSNPIPNLLGKELKYGEPYYMVKLWKAGGGDSYYYKQFITSSKVKNEHYPRPGPYYSLREYIYVGSNRNIRRAYRFRCYIGNLKTRSCNYIYYKSDKVLHADPKDIAFRIFKANTLPTEHKNVLGTPVKEGDRIWIQAIGGEVSKHANTQYFNDRLSIRRKDGLPILDYGPWGRGEETEKKLFPDIKDDETITGYMPTLIINSYGKNLVTLKNWYNFDNIKGKDFKVYFLAVKDISR